MSKLPGVSLGAGNCSFSDSDSGLDPEIFVVKSKTKKRRTTSFAPKGEWL